VVTNRFWAISRLGRPSAASWATRHSLGVSGVRAGHPFFIRAFTGLFRPRAMVLGNEFAGVVESVGPGVTRFSAGDRVFGYSPRFGAHAGLLSISQDGLVAAVPAGLSFEDVAPATEGAHYALSIIRKAGISGGQDVLVNGAPPVDRAIGLISGRRGVSSIGG
jgi:threonine dehydrogenase-like Zn-dependent dehydrogenase